MGIMDTIFVWLRYIHFTIVPLIVFAIHKDLRKKTELLVCVCWRPNSIETNRHSADRPVSAYIYQLRKERKKKMKRYKHLTNYSVPVLFATSEGLFLRVLDGNFAGFEEHKESLNVNNSLKSNG